MISQKHYLLVNSPYPACILAVTHPLRQAGKTDLRQLFKKQRATGPVRRINLKDGSGK